MSSLNSHTMYEEINATSLETSTTSEIIYPVAVQRNKSTMALGPKAAVQVSKPDRLLFRLEKLFRPTKDLGSVLTTFNYFLYLLAYFDAKAHNFKSQALSLVTKHASVDGALSGATAHPEGSPFAKLGAVVYNARTTLRLFGLLPLYVRARKLMTDSKDMDKVLWAVSAVQCSLFAIFQFLENVAFLTENGVLTSRARAGQLGGRVAAMYKIAHRAWFLGHVCDFARLMREAQIFFRRKHIDKEDITEEEAERASQWYYDWIRPLAWLPIGWQLSAWTEDGMSGKFNNLGLRGVAGVLADLKRTATLWDATKDA
ncbi:hypothetical protein QC762_0099470 [Podospora pseudocomata]|uniref:Uncharacterized protein n=1 Tax=Podospora pseudocomata TaxID=2093779 RepID=A0ABR0G8R2_9PEZI|nr:hypothetical protein QC762_0099470 [Podospora pseudocomata]